MLTGAALSILSANAAFAGAWVKGQEPNQDKWWYQNDDGTYAQNGWFWIDGNHDGVAEYYYFDSEGWALTNTVTPDGNQVNENGEWVLNGVVQTQRAELPQAQDSQAALWMWTENADGKRVFNEAVRIISVFWQKTGVLMKRQNSVWRPGRKLLSAGRPGKRCLTGMGFR